MVDLRLAISYDMKEIKKGIDVESSRFVFRVIVQ